MCLSMTAETDSARTHVCPFTQVINDINRRRDGDYLLITIKNQALCTVTKSLSPIIVEAIMNVLMEARCILRRMRTGSRKGRGQEVGRPTVGKCVCVRPSQRSTKCVSSQQKHTH